MALTTGGTDKEQVLFADKPDVVIRPQVMAIELLEHVDVREVAKLGEEAVDDVLPELNRMLSWTNRLRRKYFGGKS